MRGKQYVKIFMFLFLCTAYIFAFSHFGSLAYQTYSTNSDTYQQGTMIGPIDISGKSKEEALAMITKQVGDWQEDAEIEFIFRENKITFQNNYFQFNLSESIELAQDGQQNPLMVQLDQEELQKSLVLLGTPVTVTNDLEKMLIQIAQSLNDQNEINIDQYLVKEIPTEVIATIKIETKEDTVEFETLSNLVIKGESSFSLTKFLSENGITVPNLPMYNFLSSGIYQLILPTNFTIQERHIGAELPEDILLGYEAKLDSNLGWDLVFYNPNQEDFTIQISQQTGYVQLDLVGRPFVDQYEVEMVNEQTFSPKTIKHYDPMLLPGETKELESGREGSYIEVFRKTISNNGTVTELISKDFYAPKYRVELTSLVNNVVETEISLEEDTVDNGTEIDPSTTDTIGESVVEETITEDVTSSEESAEEEDTGNNE
ncbi:hypothetical protein [Neobacillus sp. D3-1R]|uniref:hypothetical protein n=1 Tax=Neobacillus sp. D3-1R TaxID=3445778 RepID=UPI003FA06828